MIDPNRLTYAAMITIVLPGMDDPATVTVTLTPQTMVETGSGQAKPLGDCSLAELQALAETLESEVRARYLEDKLQELAAGVDTEVEITVVGERGQPQPLEPEAWLEHAIVLDRPKAGRELSTVQSGPEAQNPGEGGPEKDANRAAAVVAAERNAGGEGDATAERTGRATGKLGEALEAAAAAEAKVAREESRPGARAAAEAVGATEEERLQSEPDNRSVPAEKEAAETETETGQDEGADAATKQREVEISAPVPEETPVVPGPEPSPAPAEMKPAVAPSKIRIAGLRRPTGHPTAAAADILINEPAFRDTQAHALSTLNREVAGMLIGPPPEKQPDGRYVVHITDAIIARHTRMHGASVTYTPESWRYVTDVLEERYPEEEAIIVGWYHTHPGFGIFLSGMDLFIHQNFFTQKWHVALVLDPLARKSGFFCWDRGQQAVQAYDFPWPSWAPNSW